MSYEKIFTILIVDDHGIVTSGLKMLIQNYKSFKVIAEAKSASEAIELCNKFKPDIIILDISLPDINGLDIISTFRNVAKETKILVLTMHENKQYLRKALEDGAYGYLLKQSADEDLHYALKVVSKGETYIQPSMITDLYSKKKITEKTRDEALWNMLSDREKEVIILVAKGFTSKEIADKLFLSDKTIATYRMRAHSKLNISTKSDLVNLMLKLNLFDL